MDEINTNGFDLTVQLKVEQEKKTDEQQKKVMEIQKENAAGAATSENIVDMVV